MIRICFSRTAFSLACLLLSGFPLRAEPLRILFWGDNGPHAPRDRFDDLQPVLSERGIELTYTDSMADLNQETLSRYDGLLLYANVDRIEPAQEQAVLEYVAGGGGFVPLHCATYCFRNSPSMVELMGAQFQRHGTGVFRTQIADPQHQIMRGFGGFESWDETYVHHRHNDRDRTVLEYRADAEGREPWTWVRTHGNGRVFYTAWGHDGRTWTQPGFHNLVERGIRWAAGGDPSIAGPFHDRPALPEMKPRRSDVAPFEYIDVGAKIPYYIADKKWGTQGDLKTTMQKPLSPTESQKHFVTPVGFDVKLFVAEPDIGGKPIAMTWDHRGRLYVCESYDYPNELQPSGKGRDRIRICADTDSDGVADQFTIFADDLSIPTAITEYRGGMIVQNGGQTLYLKDTDGDDHADLREVLIDNWAIGDTHGGVSNLRVGLDNWIWGMQGYNNSQPIINGRKQQPFRMGFFRFRLDRNDPPRVTDFEFVRSTDNNTWGLGISEEGLIFGSTANRNPSVFMPIANRYYERVRGWTKSLALKSIADTHLFAPITENVRQVDHHGGYTAGAGHALYTARRYPPAYWNRTAFVAGPTGHLVGTFVLTSNGCGFQSTSPLNLVASDDEWSAPIAAEVGPDGNVWVIDWYNYIVQHNPTPHGFETGKGNAYQSDLRDKKHGRIYRVVYGDDDDIESDSISTDISSVKLVNRLSHPTMWQRLQAQRLIVERGDTRVLPALMKLVAQQRVDKIGLKVGAIHALWTMQGIGVLDGNHDEATASAIAALHHPSAGVRRAAIAVLPDAESSTREILDSGTLTDVDAHVRLAALLALADLPPVTTAGDQIVAVMSRTENVNDPWIPDAATCAAAANSGTFLIAVAKHPKPVESLIEVTGVVADHFARGDDVDGLPQVTAGLTLAHPKVTAAILAGLERGWSSDRPLVSPDIANRLVIDLLPQLPAPERGRLLRLARRWGSDSIDEHVAMVRQSMIEQLAKAGSSEGDRIDAAQQLISLDPASTESVNAILNLITPQTPPELAVALLRTLQQSTSAELAPNLLSDFEARTPAIRKESIGVLLRRGATTAALLKAISDGTIEISELTLDQQQLLTEHPNLIVRATARSVLSRGGALPSPDRQRVIDELLPLVTAAGNAEAGRMVFKKICANCHSHSGEGGKVGPDLTGMAVHPKTELLTHIIDPSRSVEGNFRTYTILTADGQVKKGMLATESRTTIELINAEGKSETLLRDDVEQLTRSDKSLMPDGFEKQATAEELRDLLEFLTARGRYLPLDLSKVATITTARGMFYSEQAMGERLIFDKWTQQSFRGIPFLLVDPNGGQRANAIMLHSPNGDVSKRMPDIVTIPCSATVSKLHLLSGVSGWGWNGGGETTVAMIVRLHYADGQVEDHPLRNGEHFADYIRRIDVPGSEFAFDLNGRQIRYLAVTPKRSEPISTIELVKGDDRTSPIVMAVTLE